jgi:phosphate-selective porin OprO/OprP
MWINNILKCCALVVSIGANIGWTHAFTLDIKGGKPKIRSDDGNFEMVLGGRAHLDVSSFSDDKPNPAYPAFGSQLLGDESRNGFDFRRGWLDVAGKYYDLDFIVQNNFASEVSPHGLLRVWASIGLGPGRVTVGQFKPHRSMEELTSSNEITLMERPSNSTAGIYSGRQWLVGVAYQGVFADQLGYAADAMSLTRIGMPIAGSSYGGRLYWAPRQREGDTLHFGLSYSRDTPTDQSLTAKAVDVYGGRRGFTQSYGVAGAAMGPSGNRSQSTLSLEAAYALGPVTLQGEYAAAKLDNTHLLAGAQRDSHVHAYYVQASWFITGERTVYQKELGVFRKPKQFGKWGAVEIAARYDAMENRDQSLVADPCGTGTSKCRTQVLTLGLNWYVRKGVRFMLNYYLTKNAIGNAGPGTPNRTDTPSAISFRTQLNF